MYQLIAILILFTLLTACGGSDGNDHNTQQQAKKTVTSQKSNKSPVSQSLIKVSGAENFIFKNEPKFSCRDDVIHVMTMTAAPKFELYLSSKAGKGDLALADYDANRSSNSVEGKAVVALSGNFVKGSGSAYGKFYFKNSTGQVSVKNIPKEKGAFFEATVKASLQSSDGEIINVDADLQLVADGYLMQNCNL